MKKILFWILSLPLAYFITSIFSQNTALLAWVDTLFMAGLLSLTAGCVMVVISGGFFNAFAHNWKTFFSSLNRKEQVIRDVEGPQKRNDFRRDFRFSKLLIKAGLGYCAVSLLLSLLLI